MSRKAIVLYYLALLAIAILIIFFMQSCNSVKQVLSDPKKKEIVGRQWERENPCVNDTITTISLGEEIIKYDTAHEYYTDTLIDIDTQIKYITKYQTVTKTVHKTDTLRLTVEDVRRVNQLNKDISFKDGQIVQLEADKKEERKRGNKYLGLFIGLLGLNALIVFFKIRNGFTIK